MVPDGEGGGVGMSPGEQVPKPPESKEVTPGFVGPPPGSEKNSRNRANKEYADQV